MLKFLHIFAGLHGVFSVVKLVCCTGSYCKCLICYFLKLAAKVITCI